MKTMQKLMIVAVVLGSFLVLSFVVPQEQKKAAAWTVPDKYMKMTNPTKADAASINVGKMLWGKHCKSCHGNIGLGDGPKAGQLKVHPGNFTTADFQKQKDGEIYYKAIIGRDEMPNFESKIPEEQDRWALINYIRTLKK